MCPALNLYIEFLERIPAIETIKDRSLEMIWKHEVNLLDFQQFINIAKAYVKVDN